MKRVHGRGVLEILEREKGFRILEEEKEESCEAAIAKTEKKEGKREGREIYKTVVGFRLGRF